MAKEKKEEANLSPQQQKMKALQAALEKIEKSFIKNRCENKKTPDAVKHREFFLHEIIFYSSE